MKDETREALFDMAVIGLGMVALMLALACSGCYVERGDRLKQTILRAHGASANKQNKKKRKTNSAF